MAKALFSVESNTKKKRVIDLCGIKFHTFAIDDKQVFDDIYFSVGYETLVWENSFVYLYSFSQSLSSSQLLWKMVGDHLMVFEHNLKTGRIYLYTNPVSKNNMGDFKCDFLMAIKIMKKINGNHFTAVDYFVKEQFDNLFDYKHVKTIGKVWSAYDDFIFKCDDLINLEGKKYKGRRSMVNRFKREHPNYIVRLMVDDDFDAVMAVRNLWIESRFKSVKDVWDYDIFPHTLSNRDTLGMRVIVIEVDGNIQGFFIIAKLGNNCSIVVNENTNLEFKGMTEFLWYESLRMSKDLGEFENDGNGGKKGDGLYNYKLDHNPIMVIPKIGFALNKQNEQIVLSNILKEEV